MESFCSEIEEELVVQERRSIVMAISREVVMMCNMWFCRQWCVLVDTRVLPVWRLTRTLIGHDALRPTRCDTGGSTWVS